MHHPWKLRVLKVIWDDFKETPGYSTAARILDKLTDYLIPGVKFNPLSWVSAYKFIRLFVMYKGDPVWLKARVRITWIPYDWKYW